MTTVQLLGCSDWRSHFLRRDALLAQGVGPSAQAQPTHRAPERTTLPAAAPGTSAPAAATPADRDAAAGLS